eukprot:1496502-Amphidinium_carterae.1
MPPPAMPPPQMPPQVPDVARPPPLATAPALPMSGTTSLLCRQHAVGPTLPRRTHQRDSSGNI